MIEIKYTTRVFPQKSGSVAVRVRWDHKKNEVELPTGVYVDSEKWDFTTQRAVNNTKHVVRENVCSAGAINKRIGVVLGYVEDVFKDFAMADEVPDSGAFRTAMNKIFEEENAPAAVAKKSLTLEKMDTICRKFIESQKLEASWKDHMVSGTVPIPVYTGHRQSGIVLVDRYAYLPSGSSASIDRNAAQQEKQDHL